MNFQFSLLTFLLWVTTAALWMGCICFLGSSPGLARVGYVLVPLVLLGMTAAIHRLFRQAKHGWLIAAMLAPITATGAILLIAIFVYMGFIDG